MTISSSITGNASFRTWEQSWSDAEAQCLESGDTPAGLPQSLLKWLDGGSFLPPRILLGELEPHLARLYREGDPRLALAEAFIAIWNRLHPFMPLRRVLPERDPGPAQAEGRHDLWVEAVLPEDGTNLDLAWLLLPLLRAFPRAFSLPEYEAVQAVADPRRVEDILDPSTGFRLKDGALTMGSMRLGEPVDIRAHLIKAAGAVPQGWIRPGQEGACLVRADYYCPRRKRMILHGGCAYGAPGFLFRIGFRTVRPPVWNPLSRLIRALVEEGPETGEASREGFDLAPLEALVLDRGPAPGRAPFRFVYHQADDSISCDGRHLTKNVPARILRRLVRDYVQSGRREFEFRTFKRDSDIVTNRKRPNFEVRLRRVQEVILGVPCGLILHRPRPGYLELEASGPIEYAEEA